MEFYLIRPYQFLSGASLFAAFVCALFFFRYWQRSSERIFFVFGLAFLTLGIERVVLANVHAAGENLPLVYLIRLLAFLMILGGIWDKNRKRS